jgi:alpha-glucosidase (family GH31 glycosyl hydrolase)
MSKKSDLLVPIQIDDELFEEVIHASALLNIASGEITRVEYQDYDEGVNGLPWENAEYDFSCGKLSNAGKDVEFSIQVNKTTGQYSVTAGELQEIKQKAAALFAGVAPSA